MGLNFSALARYEEYTALEERGGKVYRLLDQLPTATMLRVYELVDCNRDIQLVGQRFDAFDPGEDLALAREKVDALLVELAQLHAEKRELVTSICLEIFQHTLPGTSVGELNAAFTIEQQEAVIFDFFFRRWHLSSAPTPATGASEGPENQEQTTGQARHAALEAAEPMQVEPMQVEPMVANRVQRRQQRRLAQ